MALVPLISGFVTLEVASFVLTKANLFLVNEIPSLYRGEGKLIGIDDWRTEREEWGAWHLPTSGTTHTSPCFSVTYKSNEVGARDRSFALESSKRRYLLIGDSFAEGWGVSDAERAQALIENATDTELLNFGTGGGFGPVQYWLIYEKLARKYQHAGLIVFFFPANDFTDNDYSFWRRTGQTFVRGSKERYRPYYAHASDGGYQVFYPANTDRVAKRSALKQFIIDNLWSANAMRTLKTTLLRMVVENEMDRYSGYFDSTVEQQRAAVYFIDKILKDSAASDILLVAIPALEDFTRVAAGQSRDKTYWWSQFASARERLGKPITFVDLVDEKPDVVTSLFLDCDPHWSPRGHAWAAGVIARRMSKTKARALH